MTNFMLKMFCSSCSGNGDFHFSVVFLIDSWRVYTPPDPPGYFDGHVWPMYLKNRREMEDVETGIGEYSIKN